MTGHSDKVGAGTQGRNAARLAVFCVVLILDCLLIYLIVAQQKQIGIIEKEFKASVVEINRLRGGKQ